ncbi:MAG: CNP1-like family protein [Betaproteobacteria bacterium]|nr:CNP1-like family protein [Betaproteobacteria bacterium]
MLLPLVAAAQREEEEAAPKGWVEIKVKLPPFPKPENLIAFDVSAASSNRFFVDAESISVGSDGVVRYTLVIKGSGGGENISYEGMRCETREQKYYAFGRRDGSWSNARSGEWRRIEHQDINRQHGVLYVDYFCPDRRRPVKSPRDAINRFKYGVPP